MYVVNALRCVYCWVFVGHFPCWIPRELGRTTEPDKRTELQKEIAILRTRGASERCCRW